MVSDPLIEAATYFFAEPYRIELIGDSSGYSNSRFAQVTDQQGQVWCLRGWADSTVEQMRFIHQVLVHSRTHGFAGLPHLAYAKTGESLLLLDNVWFEAQEWLTGGPLYQLETPATKQRMPNTAWNFTVAERQPVVAALAAFHASTATLQPLVKGPSLSSQILSLLEQVPAETVYTGSIKADQTLVDQWVSLLAAMGNGLRTSITADRKEAENGAIICHGDLWPAHVYFNNGVFCGFVDFGALTFTTPAIDLAQLILHFGGWQSYGEVLAIYTHIYPLAAVDMNMIPIAAALDVVSEGYWALEQLCTGHTSAQVTAAHRHNLRFLLPSLEALVEELS